MATHSNIDELFNEIEREGIVAQLSPERAAMRTLAKNLLRNRLALGMTQRELARAAGMRQPRIAEIEAAKGSPRFDTLLRVANALGVPLSALVEDIGSEAVGASGVTSIAVEVGDASVNGDEVGARIVASIRPNSFYPTLMRA